MNTRRCFCEIKPPQIENFSAQFVLEMEKLSSQYVRVRLEAGGRVSKVKFGAMMVVGRTLVRTVSAFRKTLYLSLSLSSKKAIIDFWLM